MSGWDALVAGIGLWALVSPVVAFVLARFIRVSIDNESKGPR